MGLKYLNNMRVEIDNFATEIRVFHFFRIHCHLNVILESLHFENMFFFMNRY